MKSFLTLIVASLALAGCVCDKDAPGCVPAPAALPVGKTKHLRDACGGDYFVTNRLISPEIVSTATAPCHEKWKP